VLGTRPEIIRLSRVIEKLDRMCEHVLVHTGQNFDHNLSEVFFTELGVRRPDHALGIRGDTFGRQVGLLMAQVDEVLAIEKPDRLLVLGDTNSCLSAILAKRRAIPVFHMEAGNRCYDDRVPEEVNRRVIDHSSDVLMPYTERSRQNLLREGIAGHRILVTGNPIFEVIAHYQPGIDASCIHREKGLVPRKYFLVTIHRAENVDQRDRLAGLLEALDRVQREYGLPMLLSLHPHTRLRIEQFALMVENPNIVMIDPPGFFSFVALEKGAFCVISDSGTVQEECCIFQVPNLTIRDVTERPETIECGSNMLAGGEPDSILRCVRSVLSGAPSWTPPAEYLAKDVASKVCRIVLGYLRPVA